MATLDVLFQAPPDQLPEIVRRLKAAAVPTHELVLALSGDEAERGAEPGGEGESDGQGEGGGHGSNGTVSSLGALAGSEALPAQTAVAAPGVERLEPESGQGKQARYWARRLEQQVLAALDIVGRYLWWVDPLVNQPEDRLRPLGEGAREWRRQALTRAPSLRALASGEFGPLTALLALRAYASDLPGPLGAWLEEVAEAASRSRWLAGEQLERTERLIAQTEDLASDMNMRFLYDPERKLFAIGYNVSERRMDTSFYDLLASEARLGSFVSIARGDVPVEHWVTMGRTYGLALGRRVLSSWSGTMFEYLMPLLLTRSYENSLLDAAVRAAVTVQIEYGTKRGVPWGISEAAYAAVDANQTYQYQAFGVPGLGLKRGLEDDLVVAPYASALALPVAPQEAVRNLRRLSRMGMRGPYGYYKSIDYTPQRQPAGGGGVVVYTYMVHHQGMSLLAIDNALHDQVMQRRFHADPRVRAAEPLLFERIPVAPRLAEGVARGEAPIRGAPAEGSGVADPVSRFTTPDTPTPRTQLMSNGSYAVMVTSAGGGYSRWRDFDVLRWRADTTRDAWGGLRLRQGRRPGRGLVGHLPAGAPPHGPLPGPVQRGAGGVRAPRRRDRHPHRDLRLLRGRRRGAPGDPGQLLQPGAPPGADHLPGAGPGPARGGRRPPRLQQDVRPHRGRPRAAGPPGRAQAPLPQRPAHLGPARRRPAPRDGGHGGAVRDRPQPASSGAGAAPSTPRPSRATWATPPARRSTPSSACACA